MGFLKKLFEKKDCEICGGEIGLLGNRKLVDGDMCKTCAAKLSPWFTDRKQATVAEIKEQLAYRVSNAERLKTMFKPTETLGEYYRMYVSYAGSKPEYFVISSSDDYIEENADMIRFTDITSCKVDIRDSRTEEKRRNDAGEYVSYNPPRYEFSYDFYIELGINNPYFDEIRFKVNRNTVRMVSELMTHRASSGLGQFLLTNNDFDPTYNPEFRQYQMMCDRIAEIVAEGQKPGASFKPPEEILELERQLAFGDKVMAEEDPRKKLALYEEEYARVKDDPALAEYAAKVANWVKSAQYVCMTPAEQAASLTEAMERKKKELMAEAGVPEKVIGASTEEQSVSPKLGDPGVCPDCGATGQNGKFCEYCGAKLQ